MTRSSGCLGDKFLSDEHTTIVNPLSFISHESNVRLKPILVSLVFCLIVKLLLNLMLGPLISWVDRRSIAYHGCEHRPHLSTHSSTPLPLDGSPFKTGNP